jgi:phosphate transport system permease protein
MGSPLQENMIQLNYYRRKWTNRIFALLCGSACLLSVTVLGLLLGYVLYQGISAINFDFFTHLPAPVGEPGGGMANAIVGTLILIAIASAIGIPIGITAGLYLAEYGSGRFAKLVRYLTDVLNGLPSIVMGLFAYTLIVIPMKGFSALSGGVALSILMIPVIVRTTEEVVKLVPNSLREGALALGIPRWKVILRIVVSTAKGGIVTAVVLAIARIMGETAPLLFTAFGNQFWQTNIFQPMAAMTLQIFTYAISPFDDWHAQAWAGALVLVGMSLVINVVARFFTLKGLRALR